MERTPGFPEDTGREGMEMLAMLGLEQYAGVSITLKDREPIQAKDFLLICGEHARAKMRELQGMSNDDPMRGRMIEAIRGAIFDAYIRPNLPAPEREE